MSGGRSAGGGRLMSGGRSLHTLFLVPSANHAMQGEQALGDAGIACRLLPVPRFLSSACGVCLAVAPSDRRRAETVLAAVGTRIEAVHDVELPGRRTGTGAPGLGDADCGTPAPTVRGRHDENGGGDLQRHDGSGR